MKIQTFKDGNLIEESESPDSFLPPDWGSFNRGLLTNAAYNRVTQTTTNQVSVRRLEGIAIAAGERRTT